MFVDYIQNGAGYGPMGEAVASVNFDTGLLRPYNLEPDGPGGRKVPCVTVNKGFKRDPQTGKKVPNLEVVRIRDLVDNGINSPVFNATSLRKEEWIELDKVVVRAARFRLRAWKDLAAANSFGGFNAMGKMLLEHETMSDPGLAYTDMDGLTDGTNDAPQFQLQGLPLPITHADFNFSSRKLAISRNSGTPLDTSMGEAAARRVAESIEKTTIGTNTGITYGGNSTQVGGYGRTSSVYGYVNFPQRITSATLTKPTTGGWTPATTVNEVLAMKDALFLAKFYGPYMLYFSNDWENYMDRDYTLTGGNVTTQTLRNRLRQIGSIADVQRLDFLFATAPSLTTNAAGPASYDTLNPFTILMVQMTPEVARAVNGMDITTVQWETKGGMQLNFKVMTIAVPQLRADFYGNCGILQAVGV